MEIQKKKKKLLSFVIKIGCKGKSLYNKEL